MVTGKPGKGKRIQADFGPEIVETLRKEGGKEKLLTKSPALQNLRERKITKGQGKRAFPEQHQGGWRSQKETKFFARQRTANRVWFFRHTKKRK